MATNAELHRLVAVAAETRVNGSSWDQVAAKVGRGVATVRGWPSRYAKVWDAATRASRRERDSSSDAEAIATLRNLLRDADVKIRRDAAKLLLARRRGKPAVATAPPADPFASLTDDECRLLLQNDLDRPGPD